MQPLLDIGKRTEYKKGELLLRPSDDLNSVFIITQGMVKAYVVNRIDEEEVHIIYGPSEIFPATRLIHKRPLTVYYAALSDCEVVKIPLDSFLALLKDQPEAVYETLMQVVRQFAVYIARVDNLEYKYARERLAYRLLLLARRFGKNDGDTIVLPRLNQQEIASTINMSRENVSRELKRFERLGFITHKAGGIVVMDVQGLRHELSPDGDPLYFDDL